MLPAQWTPNQGLQCLGQRIEQASRPGSPGMRLSSATETSLSGLLRHLMDSRWLLADSPMQFCFVDSCITFLSGGWCRAGQAGKPYPTRPISPSLPVSASTCSPLFHQRLYILCISECYSFCFSCAIRKDTNWQRNDNQRLFLSFPLLSHCYFYLSRLTSLSFVLLYF